MRLWPGRCKRNDVAPVETAVSHRIDRAASTTGLRTVATFEALKGIAALVLLALVAALHKDFEEIATGLLVHLHISPQLRLSRALLRAAERMTDARLWALTGFAVAYAGVRFTEAWGLWHRRVWAEWFALLSGTIYLPWEIVKLVERPNWFHVALLATNLAVIGYIAWIRLMDCLRPPCPDD